MRIAFIINDITRERPVYTTPYLAYYAKKMGHEVMLINIGDLEYTSSGKMGGQAMRLPAQNFRSIETMLQAIQKPEFEKTEVTSDDFDILFLRNNPSDDIGERAWAQMAGVVFGQIAEANNKVVINHPATLAFGITDKLYFEHFPEAVRPKALITRDTEQIREFFKEQGKIVLKPLLGSGGKDVFLIDEEETNLNQIVETISASGYVIAQEFLPKTNEGDVRLFLMNGDIMYAEGKAAAFKRINREQDFRNNLHAGGVGEKADITEVHERIARLVKPKLVQDGIFLAGLDIIGDKLVEVNVLSPGGLLQAEEFEGVNFATPVIEAIEKKVYLKKKYGNRFSNRQLATL